MTSVGTRLPVLLPAVQQGRSSVESEMLVRERERLQVVAYHSRLTSAESLLEPPAPSTALSNPPQRSTHFPQAPPRPPRLPPPHHLLRLSRATRLGWDCGDSCRTSHVRLSALLSLFRGALTFPAFSTALLLAATFSEGSPRLLSPDSASRACPRADVSHSFVRFSPTSPRPFGVLISAFPSCSLLALALWFSLRLSFPLHPSLTTRRSVILDSLPAEQYTVHHAVLNAFPPRVSRALQLSACPSRAVLRRRAQRVR